MENWREREYLSVRDISRILQIHFNTAYKLVKTLPHIKIGSTYRVSTEAFQKWIRDQERANRA